LGVRSEAAEALGEIGDPRAVEPLIKSLSDKDPFVRSTSADALAKIGEQSLEPLILSLWENDVNIFKYITEALDRIDSSWPAREETRKYLGYFSKALQSGSSHVKLYIINVLENIQDPSVSKILTKALEDNDRNVRLNAASALRRINDAQ